MKSGYIQDAAGEHMHTTSYVKLFFIAVEKEKMTFPMSSISIMLLVYRIRQHRTT